MDLPMLPRTPQMGHHLRELRLNYFRRYRMEVPLRIALLKTEPRCHACSKVVAPEDRVWNRFHTNLYLHIYFCSIDHMKQSVRGRRGNRYFEVRRFWMLRKAPAHLFEDLV